MPAAEDPQVIFRPRKAPDAADAGCIGKPGVARAARLGREQRAWGASQGRKSAAEPARPVFSNGL